jgi:hypothetical protein
MDDGGVVKVPGIIEWDHLDKTMFYTLGTSPYSFIVHI